MTVKYVLAFDTGKSSGVALLSYSETEPVRLVKAWQFGNGVQGLLDWLENQYPSSGWLLPYSPGSEAERLFWSRELGAVSEKFVPVPEPYLKSRASRTQRSMIPPSFTRSSWTDWMKQAWGCGCS